MLYFLSNMVLFFLAACPSRISKTFILFLMISVVIRSDLVTPHIHLDNFISVTCCCYRDRSKSERPKKKGHSRSNAIT